MKALFCTGLTSNLHILLIPFLLSSMVVKGNEANSGRNFIDESYMFSNALNSNLPDAEDDVAVPSETSEILVEGSFIAGGSAKSQKVKALGITFMKPGKFNIGVKEVSKNSATSGLKFTDRTGIIEKGHTLDLTLPIDDDSKLIESGRYSFQLYDVHSGYSFGEVFEIIIEDEKTEESSAFGELQKNETFGDANFGTGTFENPATSCNHIFVNHNKNYDKESSLEYNDGEYWIQGRHDKYKTLCDMVSKEEAEAQGKTVGGYTLIWSFSEETNVNDYSSTGRKFSQADAYMGFTSEREKVVYGRNVPTEQADEINFEDFRIPKSDLERFNDNVLRIRYTKNPKNLDSDIYGQNNYLETKNRVDFLANSYSDCTSSLNAFGKYLGYDMEIANQKIRIGNSVSDNAKCVNNETSGFFVQISNGYMPIEELGVVAKNFFGNYGNKDHDKQPFGKCDKVEKLSYKDQLYDVCSGNHDMGDEGISKLVVNSRVNGGEGYYEQWWVK